MNKILFAQSVDNIDPAAFWIIFAIVLVVLLPIIILMVISYWKILEKAGREGWIALIPVYGTWVIFEIAGRPGWWALAGLIPYAGGVLALIASIFVSIDLAKSFGKEDSFAILLILVPVVGYPILGFSKAQYLGPVDHTPAQPAPPQTPTQTPPTTPVQNP